MKVKGYVGEYSVSDKANNPRINMTAQGIEELTSGLRTIDVKNQN